MENVEVSGRSLVGKKKKVTTKKPKTHVPIYRSVDILPRGCLNF